MWEAASQWEMDCEDCVSSVYPNNNIYKGSTNPNITFVLCEGGSNYIHWLIHVQRINKAKHKTWYQMDWWPLFFVRVTKWRRGSFERVILWSSLDLQLMVTLLLASGVIIGLAPYLEGARVELANPPFFTPSLLFHPPPTFFTLPRASSLDTTLIIVTKAWWWCPLSTKSFWAVVSSFSSLAIILNSPLTF